ncbi:MULTISPECIES: DUF523 domain-containing protein [unclassified Agarivorans]|uniref:DUF523 domain-containing protein n=1 Tax=unclassified Agarivorans TaxID=2636026 RepID=UPI003D7DA8FD
MAKILFSACLLGCKVRYNGQDLKSENQDVDWLIAHHQIISFCPEVAAGLPTPRTPAEIQLGGGEDVLRGDAKVVGQDGTDLSDEFVLAAELALKQCQKHQIKFAVLSESSPSCGSQTIYDGRFQGYKKPGKGVTAALLNEHGIMVYNQHQASALKSKLLALAE